MPVVTPGWYMTLAAILFLLGMTGVLIRRNALVMFMCVELMLNAVNLTFVAAGRAGGSSGRAGGCFLRAGGGGRRGGGGPGDHRRHFQETRDRLCRRVGGASRMIELPTEALWLVIALPLGGAVLLHFVGRWLGEPRAGYLACAASLAAFGVAAAAAVPFLTGEGHLFPVPSVGSGCRRWAPPSRLSGIHSRL